MKPEEDYSDRDKWSDEALLMEWCGMQCTEWEVSILHHGMRAAKIEILRRMKPSIMIIPTDHDAIRDAYNAGRLAGREEPEYD